MVTFPDLGKVAFCRCPMHLAAYSPLSTRATCQELHVPSMWADCCEWWVRLPLVGCSQALPCVEAAGHWWLGLGLGGLKAACLLVGWADADAGSSKGARPSGQALWVTTLMVGNRCLFCACSLNRNNVLTFKVEKLTSGITIHVLLLYFTFPVKSTCNEKAAWSTTEDSWRL